MNKAIITKIDIVHIFVKCPYCKKKHAHGNSYREVDPNRKNYGYRVPHCMGGNPDYELVTAE